MYLAGNHLQRQADAGELAAGSHFVERAQRRALVGGHLVLHMFKAVGGGRAGQKLDVELRAFHGQILHVLAGFGAEPGGVLAAQGG